MAAQEKKDTPQELEAGRFTVGPGVLELIVSLAAQEVDGFGGFPGSAFGSLTEWLGKKSGRPVRVTVGDGSIHVEMHVTVSYGKKIPKVASAIQERVKQALEAMTEWPVAGVDISVDSVQFESK